MSPVPNSSIGRSSSSGFARVILASIRLSVCDISATFALIPQRANRMNAPRPKNRDATFQISMLRSISVWGLVRGRIWSK